MRWCACRKPSDLVRMARTSRVGLSARRPASTACFIIARRTFRIRLAVAEERLGELKAALQDMRDQRDCWQAQAERLLLAPKPDKPLTWWKWMRTSA